MSVPEVRELAEGTFLLDHRFQGVPGVIASYLLAGADELALVEAGPQSTMETLLAGVRAAGHEPERITRILLTHIHLDHAGGAGALLERLPEARVYVHPVGAPHLIDPGKLLASATRIYGDAMDRLWGTVLPVPEERLVVLDDGAVVEAGGRALRALDTPGHANHHLAYHDEQAAAVFSGDVAGVRLGGIPYVRPPTPPPELDLEAWRGSVLRLRSLRPRRLFLTHFGAYDDADWHLDDLLARLYYWAGWIAARLGDGLDTTTIAAELREAGDAELDRIVGDTALGAPLELATNYQMSVDGFARYFRKREPGAGSRER